MVLLHPVVSLWLCMTLIQAALLHSIGCLLRITAIIASLRAAQTCRVPMGAQFGREKFTTQLERRRVCQALQGTLEMVGARQLVIGHTPQAWSQAPLPVLCEVCSGRTSCLRQEALAVPVCL